MTKTWEEIRASWVNGNLSDCRNYLKTCSKLTLFKILADCLNTANSLDDSPKGTHSGDLIDLREIINQLAKGL